MPAGTGFSKYKAIEMKKVVDLFRDDEEETDGAIDGEVESNV